MRSIYADWERGDFSSNKWAHPEIEFVRADGPDAGTWTGLAGMAEGMRYRLSAWEDWRIAAAEFRDLDEERVLVLGHATARGKRSGLEVRQGNAAVFHIRADKVTRLTTYTDHVGAFADLGLEG